MGRGNKRPYPTVFGELLQQHLRFANMTPQEVALRAGVPVLRRKVTGCISGALDFIKDCYWDHLVFAVPTLTRQLLYLASRASATPSVLRNEGLETCPPIGLLPPQYQEAQMLFFNWLRTRDIHLPRECEVLVTFLRQRVPNTVDDLSPTLPSLFLPPVDDLGAPAPATSAAPPAPAPQKASAPQTARPEEPPPPPYFPRGRELALNAQAAKAAKGAKARA